MNKKFLTVAAGALVLAACSSEEPIAPPMVKNDAMGANPYRVSLTDALKNADALLGELGEGKLLALQNAKWSRWNTTLARAHAHLEATHCSIL